MAVALAFCGRCSTRCRVFSLPCLVCLSVCLLPHFSHSASSARRWTSPPRLHLEPVRRLFWLLARLGAFPWRCACVARCQHGSTMRCATMSCVCATRGTPRALNSLPSRSVFQDDLSQREYVGKMMKCSQVRVTSRVRGVLFTPPLGLNLHCWS